MPFVDAGGVTVNFPFEPYPCQIDYMQKVIACYQKGLNGILESPTGTGKTLCLLCSSLAWLEDKKAQITSQKWKIAQTGEGAIEAYKNELAESLDHAAGSWGGEMAPPKIIYASRTHTQLTQAVQEMKRTAYKHMKVCVLGSREQMCIHPQIIKEESNTAKVHLCRAKVNSRTCHFYNNVDTAKTNFNNQIMDIEDLVRLGQKFNCCPYYVSKELKNEADIIFMPYNYLLDPKSRKAHGVELQGNVVIFDEAHNLEKICEDSASFDWKPADIAGALRELEELSHKLTELLQSEEAGMDLHDDQNTLAEDFTLKDLLEIKAQLLNLEEQIDAIQFKNNKDGITKPGKFIYEIFEKANVRFDNKNMLIDVLDKVVTYLSGDSSNRAFSSKGTCLSKYCDILKLIFSREPHDEWSNISNHQSVVSKHYKVHIQQAEQQQGNKKKSSWDTAPASNKKGRTLSYWCFSSGHTMEELKQLGVRSVILTSGTLSPLASFKTEMGIDFAIQLENPHVIEKHQLWVGILGKGPDGVSLNSSYQNRFRPEYQSSLGRAIVNFSRTVPNGLLLFFPSYPVMGTCLDNWQSGTVWKSIEQYKPVYVEPKGKHEFTAAIDNFYQTINDTKLNGAVFAAVCRGKVSEGLDFSDINGRAVVITGLPFPPRMDPKVILKMQYLDEMRAQGKIGLTGNEWYRQQASRAVNQAIGRVIRHKEDYGAIMLCDDRFSSPVSQSELPSWLKPYVKVYKEFGLGLRDMMMFFKTAEKKMPAPRPTKQKQVWQNEANGCQGASFMTSSKPKQFTNIQKASAVTAHVPSLNTKPLTEETSLAKLTIQYENTQKAPERPKQFLDALESNAPGYFPFSGVGADSAQHKAPSTSTQLSKGKQKKKILLKSSKPVDVSKECLQSAEEYLSEVKRTITLESYGVFSKCLSQYKNKEEFDPMVECLASIFTDDPGKYSLFRRFYRFVRPQHKLQFHTTCLNLTDQGCGYKPEHSIPKKRQAPPPDKPSKMRKLNDAGGKEFKTESVSSLYDKGSDGISSQQMSAKSTSASNPKTVSFSSSKLDSLKTSSASTVPNSNINSTEPKLDNQNIVNKHHNTKQNCGSSTGVSGNGEISRTATIIKSGETKTQCMESKEHKSNKTVLKDVTDKTPMTSDNTMNEDKNAQFKESAAKLFPAGVVSDIKCCHCHKNSTVPLKSHCGHVCCLECWKTCITASHQCPECKTKVKRKNLTLIRFPPPAPKS